MKRLTAPLVPAASRSMVTLIVVAVPIFAALLLAFQHVVHSGIAQGIERREITVKQVSAARSCNALANVRMQEQCLLALSTESGAGRAATAFAEDSFVANPGDDGLMAAIDQPLKARTKR